MGVQITERQWMGIERVAKSGLTTMHDYRTVARLLDYEDFSDVAEWVRVHFGTYSLGLQYGFEFKEERSRNVQHRFVAAQHGAVHAHPSGGHRPLEKLHHPGVHGDGHGHGSVPAGQRGAAQA